MATVRRPLILIVLSLLAVLLAGAGVSRVAVARLTSRIEREIRAIAPEATFRSLSIAWNPVSLVVDDVRLSQPVNATMSGITVYLNPHRVRSAILANISARRGSATEGGAPWSIEQVGALVDRIEVRDAVWHFHAAREGPRERDGAAVSGDTPTSAPDRAPASGDRTSPFSRTYPIIPWLEAFTTAATLLPHATVDVQAARFESPAGVVPVDAEISFGSDVPSLVVTTRGMPAAVLPATGAGTIDGEFTLNMHEQSASFTLNGRATQIVLELPAVSPEPLEFAAMELMLAGTVDPNAPIPPHQLALRPPGVGGEAPRGAGNGEDALLRGILEIDAGSLTVGPATSAVSGRLVGLNVPLDRMPRGLRLSAIAPYLPARLDVALSLPETPLADLLGAAPPALLGPLTGADLAGSVAWDMRLEAPLERLAWTWWEQSTRFTGFSIRSLPPAVDVRTLRDETGTVPTRPRSAPTAPPTAPLTRDELPAYVPYADLPQVLIDAVITTEDGDFFRHNGINWRAIVYALERNLQAGATRFGGSTIPMQLMKNLYLDGRRILSRKVQELILVGLIRRGEIVSRERILEIYLNVIEFGPSLYGIADAVRFYFDKPVTDLTTEEAVWLATIIRSPRVLSRHARVGAVPEAWRDRMNRVMDTMVARSRLDPAEAERARNRPVQFAIRP